jgi:hypothetical protein
VLHEAIVLEWEGDLHDREGRGVNAGGAGSRWAVLAVAALALSCKRAPRSVPAGDAAAAAVGAAAATAAPRGKSAARPIIALDYLASPWFHRDLGVEVVDDPRWSPEAKVELDETFLFELGMGSGRDGFDLTVVPRSGRGREVFREGGEWRIAEIRVDEPEIQGLARVLDESRFLQLGRAYEQTTIDDGDQWIVHLRTGGRDKYVYLSNTFPEAVVRVVRFVAEHIVDARPGLRESSKPTRYGQRHADHLWRGKRRYDAALGKPVAGTAPLDDLSAYVDVLTVPDDPLPPGARLVAALVDRSAGGEVVARGSSDQPWFGVRYDAGAVDPRHRYAILVQMLVGGRAVAAGEEIPVITYDAAHAVDVPLRRP